MNEARLTLKEMLLHRDPRFCEALTAEIVQVEGFGHAIQLNTLRKRGLQENLIPANSNSLKLAIVGGCSLRPLADLIELFASANTEKTLHLWVGDYDNYISEIIDESSGLYAFSPDVTVLLPSESRCRFTGSLLETYEDQQAEATRAAQEITSLCDTLHLRTKSEIVLVNFKLSPYPDPGASRSSTLLSEYSFRKEVNSAIGRSVKPYLHLCDAEYIANTMGTLVASDDRAWFESKQPGSKEFLVGIAKEIAFILRSLHTATKKVAILDLDNTLWGGVIGDDGIEGIELGTTSARGEAFRHFQEYLLSLSKRGILLAVCSKNNFDIAIRPFREHPEMVIKYEDIITFRINWDPKSENIKDIATELNLGLDSFVFLDDNRAEIEIVKQFAPQVAGIWLGDDPSTFTLKVQESRLFETRSITTNDLERVSQYKSEKERATLQSQSTDMQAYLDSLEMEAVIRSFSESDAPRISQLINKSNQFNLTTVRRTESEVLGLIGDISKVGITVRLSDRFGDHGLIGILICEIQGTELSIETWIMSCRVLKRQVEDLMLNSIFEIAKKNGCTSVCGTYIPTAKNGMVECLYPDFGFQQEFVDGQRQSYKMNVSDYEVRPTQIKSV